MISGAVPKWALTLALPALLLAGCSSAQEQPGETRVERRGETAQGAVEYVEVSRRAGATQGFLLLHARAPVGSVILFTGGDGVVLLRRGEKMRGGNFLVRMRRQFAEAGFNVAVVDRPSDQANLKNFRTSAAHALDTKGVIAHLRSVTAGPVWLIGTSNGTVSAASVAARLSSGGPDGIVLTSTVTQGTTSVYGAHLGAIRGPVLIVHHRSDACHASTLSGAEVLAEKLKAHASVDVQTFTGGLPPESGECDPFAPHGYFGIEATVVAAIADWMKAHAPAPAAQAARN